MIPAKETSTGVKDKNLKHLNGKPLITYTIEAALNSMLLDEVWVNSDSELILRMAEDLGCKAYKRDKNLAEKRSSMTSVVIDFNENYKRDYEALILLQPTSPLRNSDHIDMAIRKYDIEGKDTLVSINRRAALNAWRDNYEKNFPLNRSTQRQDRDMLNVENGAIYITKRSYLNKFKNISNLEPAFYNMSKISSIDVDDYDDWKICERLLR